MSEGNETRTLDTPNSRVTRSLVPEYQSGLEEGVNMYISITYISSHGYVTSQQKLVTSHTQTNGYRKVTDLSTNEQKDEALDLFKWFSFGVK